MTLLLLMTFNTPYNTLKARRLRITSSLNYSLMARTSRIRKHQLKACFHASCGQFYSLSRRISRASEAKARFRRGVSISSKSSASAEISSSFIGGELSGDGVTVTGP